MWTTLFEFIKSQPPKARIHRCEFAIVSNNIRFIDTKCATKAVLKTLNSIDTKRLSRIHQRSTHKSTSSSIRNRNLIPTAMDSTETRIHRCELLFRIHRCESHRYENCYSTFYIDPEEDRYEGTFKNNCQTLLQLEFHIGSGEGRYKRTDNDSWTCDVNESQVNLYAWMSRLIFDFQKIQVKCSPSDDYNDQ